MEGLTDHQWIKYGTESGNYTNQQFDSAMVTLHSINLTGLSPDTTYYFVVNSTDASDNSNQSREYSFKTAEELTLPSNITNVTSTSLTANSATITWNTNDACDSLIKYGTESGNYTNQEFDPAMVTSHSIILTGLSPDTAYHFVVNSTDASNNSDESKEYSFRTEKSDSSHSSSGKSSSGGGGSGTSGEAFANILISETERENVYKDTKISFSFNMEGNIVRFINFTALKSHGQVTAKVEILNNTSTLVERALNDKVKVYRNLNLWVGNLGWANSKNIANPTVNFMVEKSWINENEINDSTIKLYRYSDGGWNSLNTNKTGENANNLFFEAETPQFSPFAVCGKTTAIAGGSGIDDYNNSIYITNESEEFPDMTVTPKKSIPGFKSSVGFILLLILLQILRKKKL